MPRAIAFLVVLPALLAGCGGEAATAPPVETMPSEPEAALVWVRAAEGDGAALRERLAAWPLEEEAFTFTDETDIEFRIWNDRGFANVDPVNVFLRVLEDQKPVVWLDYPATDTTSIPGELIPAQFRVEDDLGIEEVFIQYILNPEQADDSVPRELPVPLDEKGARNLSLSAALDLDKTGAVPGDTLRVVVRSRDAAGNDGESRPVTVSIVSFARGENERRRLEVLDFTERAINRLADTPPAAGDPSAIDTETYKALTELADKMLAENYNERDTIIREGDPGDKFYLIRHGTVEVIAGADAEVVATLGEGDFFGEAALLTGEPRNASVVAKDEVVLYSLDKENFQHVLDASAPFSTELRKALFERQ